MVETDWETWGTINRHNHLNHPPTVQRQKNTADIKSAAINTRAMTLIAPN